MKVSYSVSATLGALVLFAQPVQADLAFFDGTFNDSDWTTILNFGNGTATGQQVSAGGNPGAYRRVDHLNFSGEIQVTHLHNAAIVNPNLTPITSIDWSQDEIAIQNAFGIGIAFYPSLLQNGKYYVTFANGSITNDPSWASFSLSGLTSADFRTFQDATDHPNFSATGSQIQLGFNTGNNNPGFTASRAAGFDNWSVTVHTAAVPEASSLAMGGVICLFCIVGYVGRRFLRVTSA